MTLLRETETLLYNVLPEEIVKRLKDKKEEVIADDYSGVSILFADIANFTVMSSEITSRELVALLSTVFERLDKLVEEHGVEKIKTIGDAYMVASGVPADTPDHAERLALFAISMQEELNSISKTLDKKLQIH